MRLKYIDCLRGAAMFMVVYSHIMSFCMEDYTPSPLGAWMRDVMLPLFFFISGYVAYKTVPKTGIIEYGRQMWKKTTMMLIPTILMMALMLRFSSSAIVDNLFRYDKAGYWFTMVLFQIVAIFLPFLMLTKLVRQPLLKAAVLLIPYALMMIIFRLVGFDSSLAVLFEWVKVKGYYLFFAIGAVTNMMNLESERLPLQRVVGFVKRNETIVPTTLLVLSIIIHNRMWAANLILLVIPIYLLYFGFRALEPWLTTENNRLADTMSTIGRYTLPIYLMHFFLLFRLPNELRDYLVSLQTDYCFGSNSCSSFVEFILVGLCSLLICHACILITNLLKRITPPIAQWFLGIK